MSKVSVTTVANLEDTGSATDAINENFATLAEAFENTLSRDGTAPNEMDDDLDMDSNRILNLPSPTTSAEPATKGYVDSIAAMTAASSVTAAVAAAAASATSAAASAVTAAAQAAALRATSVSTHTPSVASKVFVLAETTDRQMTTGTWVLIRSDAAPTTVWMFGQVTAYNTTTEELTVDVQAIGTASAASDWTITVAGIRGATGAAGANGAAGADYTADAELNALSTLTATEGLLCQTADNVFTTRNIAGTANKIDITNPAGIAGNPTINVGTDILQRNVTKTMTVGHTHTPYDHGTLSGVSGITPLPSLGYLQKVALDAAATVTITAPTAEEGFCILQITNTGAPTSVTFASFDKTLLGATFSTTINKIHWVFIYSIGTAQVMQLQSIA